MATKFSRAAPSPRYRRLVEQYKLMHLHGETHLGIPPEKTFPGASLPKEALRIKRLIKLTGARTILDYGAGEGQQYLPLPHCTIKPVKWWEEKLEGPARSKPQVRYEIRLAYLKADELKESCCSAFRPDRRRAS